MKHSLYQSEDEPRRPFRQVRIWYSTEGRREQKMTRRSYVRYADAIASAKKFALMMQGRLSLDTAEIYVYVENVQSGEILWSYTII